MESIVKLVIQKLNDFATKEADLLFGVDEQVISLRSKLEWMRAFLKDVDRIGRDNERFKIWVTQIRDVAYDAEDVIDSYILEQKRGETNAGLIRCLSSFVGFITDIPAILCVGKKIRKLERRLGEIKENISQFGGVGNISVGGEASTSSNQSQLRREKMAPIVEEADVVGFEDETETLVGRLTEGDARRAVISITGMGGLEGFVQRRGEEEMEDVAEDYLDELISRSMIQVASRRSNGTVDECRIHDLLRDLSISEAKEERFLEVHGNMAPELPTKARRLAITCGDISKSISLNCSTPQLRSFLRFSYEGKMLEKPQLNIIFGAFKLLGVMDLRRIQLSSLPDEIGYLIHLRYLCLAGARLERLPSTITRLSNLQTLNLDLTNVHMLPDDIWKMEQIRHLHLLTTKGLLCQISNVMQIHRLINLQTLKFVKGGSWIEDGLEKLTNLRDLGIIGDLKMALSHSIHKLASLRSLNLQASPNCSIPAFPSFSNHHHLFCMNLGGLFEKLPDAHEFPPNLTELHLRGSQLEQDQIGTLEMLPNLRKLSLFSKSYIGKEMICSVGGFPLLDDLCIKELDELEEWRVEEGAMLNLRRLEIMNCKKMKMLPDGLRHISTLQDLQLKYMPEEFKERVRKDDGEDWFKIRHVPSVTM